jgi:hypothetical protein
MKSPGARRRSAHFTADARSANERPSTLIWRSRVIMDQLVSGSGEGAWDMMAEPDVIRTPDQRVRVFVSSTLSELAGAGRMGPV